MRSDTVTLFAQMMMSGAIATIGVTWRTIAYGKSDSSSHFDCVNTIASVRPTTTAAVSAASEIDSVIQSDDESDAQSLTSVRATRSGSGRMYGGMPRTRTTSVHAARNATPR